MQRGYTYIQFIYILIFSCLSNLYRKQNPREISPIQTKVNFKSAFQSHWEIAKRKKKHANKTKTTKETKNQNKNEKQLAALS